MRACRVAVDRRPEVVSRAGAVARPRQWANALQHAWIAHHRATALTNSQTYTRVIRLLAEFTDGCLAARGLAAAEARLDGAVIDLTEVIFAFEKDVQDRYPTDSPTGSLGESFR